MGLQENTTPFPFDHPLALLSHPAAQRCSCAGSLSASTSAEAACDSSEEPRMRPCSRRVEYSRLAPASSRIPTWCDPESYQPVGSDQYRGPPGTSLASRLLRGSSAFSTGVTNNPVTVFHR